jgi:hypothetical protein
MSMAEYDGVIFCLRVYSQRSLSSLQGSAQPPQRFSNEVVVVQVYRPLRGDRFAIIQYLFIECDDHITAVGNDLWMFGNNQ